MPAHSRPFVVWPFVLALIFPWQASGQDLFSDGPCLLPNTPVTVPLPPEDCGYLAQQVPLHIIDGLPPGTTIEILPVFQGVHCGQDQRSDRQEVKGIAPTTGPCSVVPTAVGGERIDFDTVVVMAMRGTGELTGFHRVIPVQTGAQWVTGSRDPTQQVQTFSTEIDFLSGGVIGDPDFASLQLAAGAAVGLHSPGQTTLTTIGDQLHVDSFFDITYEITFAGAPGGELDGLSGATVGTSRIEAAATRRPCIVPNEGTDTVGLPPTGCDHRAAEGAWQIIDGLPPGTTIELSPRLTDIACAMPTGACEAPGGGLGGHVQVFTANLLWQLHGTGSLEDYRRTLYLPVILETHSGPRLPGDAVQAFPTDLISLQGQISGDPDFAQLTVVAGSANGLPGPGSTVLEDRGDGTWSVDSFFDVDYQIDFVGAPGGVLEGLSGSTSQSVPSLAREGASVPAEPNNGTGTATIPPESAAYEAFEDHYLILDGLPAGSTIEIVPSHHLFLCDNVACGTPLPDGTQEEGFSASAELDLSGTGSLLGFQRSLALPLAVQTRSGLRIPGQSVQRFDTEIIALQGALFGDPDFSELLLQAGISQSLPSPGHTTLTGLGNETFQVDSFFDIDYRIDFVGAPGGQLDGLSGITTGSLRVTAVPDSSAQPRNIEIRYETRPQASDDVAFSGDLGSFILDDDNDPARPNYRLFSNLLPGSYQVIAPVPMGKVALGIECNDPDNGNSFPVAGSEVVIDLDLGESITCTFIDGTDDLFGSGFEGPSPTD